MCSKGRALLSCAVTAITEGSRHTSAGDVCDLSFCSFVEADGMTLHFFCSRTHRQWLADVNCARMYI
eukprot:2446387-Amphidinium_carterae.1